MGNTISGFGKKIQNKNNDASEKKQIVLDKNTDTAASHHTILEMDQPPLGRPKRRASNSNSIASNYETANSSLKSSPSAYFSVVRQNSDSSSVNSQHVVLSMGDADVGNASRSREASIASSSDTEAKEAGQHTILELGEPPKEESSHNDWARWGNNIAKTVMRNAVSVAVPTAAREGVRFGVLEPLLKAGGPWAGNVVGGIAALAPVALEVAGIIRDAHNGTGNVKTNCSRVAQIMLVGGAFTVAATTGTLAAAGPAVAAANFVYTPLRDLVQTYMKLGDNNKSLDFKANAASAAIYGVNQMLVDQTMTELTNAFTSKGMAKIGANMLAKALINVVGETFDEVTNRGLTNRIESKSDTLEVSLTTKSLKDVGKKEFLNAALNSNAGRSSLFSSAFLNAYSSNASGWASSAVVGASLAAGYLPFVYTHDQRAPANLSSPA